MFAIAGFESSSESLAWALFEVYKKIQTEIARVLGYRSHVSYQDYQKLAYLKCVWKETLRLHPAAGFLLRVATLDTTLWCVPERWADENSVVHNALLSFSCGPERRPGRPLADFEGVIILAQLFRAFNIKLGCEREEIVGISDWTERAKWGVCVQSATADCEEQSVILL